ncbi:hypothetical protein NLL46_28150, partial [Klebsiella pneumoniae]|nr:hypothetical protein [Klebsiella pneumoniae]
VADGYYTKLASYWTNWLSSEFFFFFFAEQRDWFEVSLIPTTRELTTLGSAAVGTRVNLEVDVVAKYVERLMRSAG